MTGIRFSDDERADIVRRLQHYFDDQLKQEIGRFDAEFLMDFFTREVGAAYYNRGLLDARAVLAGKLNDIDEAIAQLEQPSGHGAP